MERNALTQAERYHDAGLAIVPALHGSKECKFSGWQNRRLSRDELDQHFNGADQNFAIACGSLSDGLVVVDCDWPEAARLAEHLLPHTPAWGRDSDPLSHYLLRCRGIPTIKHKFAGADRRQTVIEILSDKHLCLLPGSLHPSGELVRFSPAHRLSQTAVAELSLEELQRWVSRIAAGAVLLHYWPTFEGTRHDLTLALAGACLHNGWSPEDVAKFFVGFFQVADDPEAKDRIACVKSTIQRFADGETVAGWPKAADMLGDELARYLAEKLELKTSALDSLIIGGKPLVLSDSRSDWPELLPFDSPQASDQRYPAEALGSLSEPVQALAELQQVPIALAAQSILTALSTATQGLYDVAVDCHQRTPISLWMVLVAAPGERKSSTHDKALVQHRSWQEAAIQRYRTALEDYDATPKAERADRPRMPILLPSSGTTEGLLKALADNWPSAGFFNADGGDWLYGYSMREGRAVATLAVFSRLWDGISDIAVKVGAEPQILYGRRLTLSLMVQPEVVAGMMGRQFFGQGFNSRVLIAYPASAIGSRPFQLTRQLPWPLLKFGQRVRQLLDTPMVIDPHSGAITTTALRLTESALSEYERHFNAIESTLAAGGVNRDIAETANKATNQLLRLAANMAVYAGREEITEIDIQQGAELVNFHLQEWRLITGRLSDAEPSQRSARLLLDWLHTHTSGPFKLRLLCQKGPRGCGRTADDMKKVLAELMRRGYVRPVAGNQYELRPESEE